MTSLNKTRMPFASKAFEEAADWLLRIQEAPLTKSEQQQFEQWQHACTANMNAWQKAGRLIAKMDTLPKELSMSVLNRPDDEGRRLAISKLALLLAAGPLLWGGNKFVESQQWTADYRTAKGGFREVSLPDGSHVKMNTATAFDMQFDHHGRVLTLREGEIEIFTKKADPNRFGPFLVRTREGTLTPLGTKFTVRQRENLTSLAVLEGHVHILPSKADKTAGQVIDSGQQADFSIDQIISTQSLIPESTAWLNRMLAVHDMPLKEFIKELARYRPGVLRVSDKLANILISGAFPTTDTNTILNMLSHTYPIKVSHFLGDYWTTLEPALSTQKQTQKLT